MEEQGRSPTAKRAAYSRPVIEDVGSLRELTAAGGPNFAEDSQYNGFNVGAS
ncbi:MAG TPA: lasso RiPP family leader peptide-containing protein [Solirubrobacteraceae bacterium]|jgi:hypothetical protein|nr:lasso RiPP family leader peptide-containing protein [Solirubrobacteraceae bacterium]